MNNMVIPMIEVESLNEKVEFLNKPQSYGDTAEVEALETHMSWVFLTDKYVYKLKKPVSYQFLDFSTASARYRYCKEEFIVNQPLAGDVYLGVVPLISSGKSFSLNGKGEVVDWLVKMRRLPKRSMLDEAIKDGTVRNEWVRKAAEKLVDFYLQAPPIALDGAKYHKQLVDDIELNCAGLLAENFKLPDALVRHVRSNLIDFVNENRGVLSQRIINGRIIDAHGDLRPDHICLGPSPIIIDRLEFNRSFRIMDVAEELAFFSMECDMLLSPETGDLFLNVYNWESHDNVPEMLVEFFKAKRAFLRARLSINHLLEEKYMADERKWTTKCEAYLKAAAAYCECLPNKHHNEEPIAMNATNEHLPFEISEYIKEKFRDDFLFEVKKIEKVKGRKYYTIEVTKDNYIHTLRLNEKGIVANEGAEPAFPPDTHEEANLENIPE